MKSRSGIGFVMASALIVAASGAAAQRGERLSDSLEPVRQPRPLDGGLRLAHPRIGSRESTPSCGEDLHGIPPPGPPAILLSCTCPVLGV